MNNNITNIKSNAIRTHIQIFRFIVYIIIKLLLDARF